MNHQPPVSDITTASDPATATPPSPLRRFLGIGLIAFALLASVYLLVGYLAWQSGQVLLVEKQQTELNALLARQIQLAQDNIAQGSYNLAQRRLEWVLSRSPQHPEALALWQQLQEALPATAVPPTAVTAPEPTATPRPTLAPGEISDPDAELSRIQHLMRQELWADAISALLVYQRQFPNQMRSDTDKMLYDSYLALGLELINGEQAELGLYYFDQAEKLGNLPQEAQDYRLWAEWYSQGIAFYGANWNVALGYFRNLCLAAPFYQSACDRLGIALFSYGDQLALAQDWCPAVELYREARQYVAASERGSLNEKLNTAQTGCLSATPTPTTITGTLPITSTVPITTGTQLILPLPTP